MKRPRAKMRALICFVSILGGWELLLLQVACRQELSSLPSNVPYVSARKSTAGDFIASAVAVRGVTSEMYVESGRDTRGCISGWVSSRRM